MFNNVRSVAVAAIVFAAVGGTSTAFAQGVYLGPGGVGVDTGVGVDVGVGHNYNREREYRRHREYRDSAYDRRRYRDRRRHDEMYGRPRHQDNDYDQND